MNNDKVLLVTGASSDVGRAFISRVARNYTTIWAHYNSSASLIESLRSDIGDVIVPVQADFSDMESTRQLVKTIEESGNIPNHIVHFSAPKVHSLQFHKFSWENYQRDIDVSLRSITMILQAFIYKMSKQKYGKIVFILSAYLLGVSPKFQSPYITAKYALLGLMKTLAAEYASKGITANAISPDMMETKFLSELPEFVKDQGAKNNPLGRNIYVEEVVPTIEYLLSAASDAVTGQNIGVTM